MSLTDTFTSTGAKFFAHQEAMQGLRNGKAKVVTTHLMVTDTCAHSCAFCSVHHREGNTLAFDDIMAYLDILIPFGLKSTIISGGGNPILYKCPKSGKNFNDLVDRIHERGLEIGLITDGMPLKKIMSFGVLRNSWMTVFPSTLDKITWIRISMAGLDHEENAVMVPDIDPTKTTLGFSYVAHDLYVEKADKAHGKVSTPADLISGDLERKPDWALDDRLETLTDQFTHYCKKYKPIYLRLLPNCLEPPKIAGRCEQLRKVASVVNAEIGRDTAFVQYKPPSAPKACYLGYVHPVLNSDGFVLPCDSCCLNESSGHKLGEPWRICHWSEIAKIYQEPVRSLIKDPGTLCPGCVFPQSNAILGSVVDGTADLTPPSGLIEHINFI